MQLRQFRVQNYKKVRDSGWISCERLMVFVGKNEAGKSTIFRGLSKLNPSDGEGYDGLREFPRSRYADEFHVQDWPVASARFRLEAEECNDLVSLAPILAGLELVEVTRCYSGRYLVDFRPAAGHRPVTAADLRERGRWALQEIGELVAPNGNGEALPSFKQSITSALQQAIDELPSTGQVEADEAQSLLLAITNQIGESWQRDLLEEILNPLRDAAQRAAVSDQVAEAAEWVIANLPRFIYFDRYGVLDSAIHIPTYLLQRGSDPSVPAVRTTQCLFRHVGIDPAEIANLGQHQTGAPESEEVRRQLDERAILLASASDAITRRFQTWWEQLRHKFSYTIDGDYFRIWVSDDLDSSPIELDQRSAGMQYFFSFYTILMVEAADHADSILLLDEPGLHLHASAQAALVKFLKKLSEENQTFYSTHSPFMIDPDHLERVRTVHEGNGGSAEVSEDVWPSDKDTLFPLLAALSYRVARGFFVAKRRVILEGITDLWLLMALNQGVEALGLERLRSDIVPIPCADLSNLMPLVTLLTSHEVEVATLLGGTTPAREETRKLIEKAFGGDRQRTLFVGDFLGDGKSSELEDMFPRHDYLDAVRTAYPQVDLDFSHEEESLPGIVTQVDALFRRKGRSDFEKWRPAAILRDRVLENPEQVDRQVLEVVARINATLNQILA